MIPGRKGGGAEERERVVIPGHMVWGCRWGDGSVRGRGRPGKWEAGLGLLTYE